MTNGYVSINLNDPKIYSKAIRALTSGKPILVEDAPEVYYADSIAMSGDDVVIVKGGKTITITDANSVSSQGLVTAPTMENIVDLAGNKRFIESEFDTLPVTGVTIKYAKWSLSGTHLMIVLAGDIADTTVLTNSTKFAEFNIPKWIADKIAVIWGDDAVLNVPNNLYSYTWATQYSTAALTKNDNTLTIYNSTAVTLTADRSFRIQFDLLIDAE